MKLISLHIDNFGTLSSFDYNFKDELNTFYEDNGWGKTTFCAFLEVMLYGITKKGNSVSTSIRKKYAPWNKGIFGGTLTIEVDGNRYRIERTFEPVKTNKDTFKLIDLTTNLESTKYSSNIGEEILNIGPESFARSIFIPENSIDFNFDEDLKSKLANLIGGTTDVDTFNEAYTKLEERQKVLKQGKTKGLILAKKKELSEVNENILECENEIDAIERIESSRSETTKKLNKLNLDKEELVKKEALYHKSLEVNANIKVLEEYQNKSKQILDNIEVLSTKLDVNTSQEKLDLIKEKVAKLDKNNLLLDALTKEDKVSNIIARNELDYPYLDSIKEEVDRYYRDDQANTSTKGLSTSLGIILIFILLLFIIGGVILLNINMIASIALMSLSGVGIVGLITYLVINFKNNKSSSSNNKTNLDNKLREAFGKYGLFSSDYNSSYLSLVTIVNEARKIEEEKASKKEKEATLREESRIIEKELNEYFSLFSLDKSSYSDKIHEIDNLLYQKKFLDNELKNNELKIEDYKKTHDINRIDINFDIEDIKNQKEEIENQIIEINKNNSSNDVKVDNYSKSYAKKQELLDTKVDLEEEIRSLEKEYDLVTKTMNYLKEANEKLLAKYVKPMKDGIKKYLDVLSPDIQDFDVNINFDFSINEEGGSKEIDFLSNGYKHLISLCMRLSLIDCLFVKESPFIVLDDPFSSLDENKLDLSTKLIKEIAKDRQVIYFTCHCSRIIK